VNPTVAPPHASLNEPLLTCQQAAALLAVKPAWIYAATRSGKLTRPRRTQRPTAAQRPRTFRRATAQHDGAENWL